MVWSFILSRTLVPTMAKYLLHPHEHHGHAEAPTSRNLLVRFQRGFERGFERLRRLYTFSRSRRSQAGFRRWLHRLRRAVVPARAISAATFPFGRCRPILMHVVPKSAPVSKTSRQFAQIQKAIRTVIPPDEIETMTDTRRADKRHQHDL